MKSNLLSSESEAFTFDQFPYGKPNQNQIRAINRNILTLRSIIFLFLQLLDHDK